MTQSQENEFGDKNNLETGPKWAQFGPSYFLGFFSKIDETGDIERKEGSGWPRTARTEENIH